MRICNINGCNQKHKAKGYCKIHYDRLQRGKNPIKKTCSVDGCNNKHKSGGYCNTHYLRMICYASTELPKKEIKACMVENCTNKYHGKGYCGIHLARFKRTGDTNIILKKKSDKIIGVKLCECGCGEIIPEVDKRGRKLKYKLYHSSKIIMADPKIKGKISDSNKGQKVSDKTKLKQSKKRKEFYANGGIHPMYGKHHTEEANEKNRVAAYKRPITNENFHNTKPERFLQSILSVNGVEYTTQKNIYGKPDIFIEPSTCVFVDGDYWHCHPDQLIHKDCPNVLFNTFLNNSKVKTSKQVWDHDEKVTNKLKKQGYIVLRFRDKEINDDIHKCLKIIQKTII